VALSNDKDFASAEATAELGGSAKPFEKGLNQNFRTGFATKSLKYINFETR